MSARQVEYLKGRLGTHTNTQIQLFLPHTRYLHCRYLVAQCFLWSHNLEVLSSGSQLVGRGGLAGGGKKHPGKIPGQFTMKPYVQKILHCN